MQINRQFSQQTFWLVIEGKTQVLLIELTMVLFYSSVPVSNDSVPVSQHAQLFPMLLFPTVTCQNVFCEKGLFLNEQPADNIGSL